MLTKRLLKLILLTLCIIPTAILAQTSSTNFSIQSLSETKKTVDGRYTMLVKVYSNEDLQNSYITINEDGSQLKFSFDSHWFTFYKTALESDQNKIFYQHDKEIAIYNETLGVVSYWSGKLDDDLSMRFIHFKLK